MELNVYDIIKRRLSTSKSEILYKNLKQISFEVNKNANKVMVRQAVEKIWNVKVDKVRIINLHGKNKEFAKRSFKTSGIKKAIITLKKGYEIELPGHFETMGGAKSGVKHEGSEVK